VAETLGSVIDQITDLLLGFSSDTPMYGTLDGTIQDDDLTMRLVLPSQSQPQGLVEVDQELIQIISFDSGTGIATIPAWGRAQKGSTATAHLTGTKVTVNPRWPRARVASVINQVVAASCPPLFGVARTTLDTAPFTYEYALPAGTRNLIKVELLPWSSTIYDWMPIRNCYIKRDTGSPVLHLDPNLTLIGDHEVRVTVATNPVALANESDPWTNTGLAESAIGAIIAGTIPMLVSTSELSRQQLTAIEVSERATLVPATSGVTVARFYQQLYQTRLDSEATRLRQEYPIRQIRTS
jgi:hypothetical protein